MKKIIFIFIFTLILDSAYSQVQWQWQMPQPTGNILYDVKMQNEQTGYSCGAAGNILKTTNGGLNWVMLNTGSKIRLLYIFILDAANIYVCGDSSLILKSTNEGLNWTETRLNTGATFFSLYFNNSNTGFVSGGNGSLFKTTNAGLNWNQINTGFGGFFYDVKFANINTGYIGGNRIILKSTNGGVNWFDAGAVFSSPFAQTYSIHVQDSETVYGMIVSENKFVVTTNGGTNWTQYDITIHPTNGSSFDILRKIKFINAQTGYLATDFGRVCKTTNAGANWNQDSTFKFPYRKIGVLWGVDAVGNSVSASGGGGTIIRSTNAGQNYSLIQGWKHQLNDIKFINQQTGFTVGDRGDIFKTSNEGNSWEKINSNTINNLTSVDFINPQTGYITGDTGTILKTTNQGLNWNIIVTGLNNLLYDSDFINNDTGYICGKAGLIIKTTNSGNSWFQLNTGDIDEFKKIKFFNSSTGVAVHEAGIRLTTNAGSNWNALSGNINGVDIHLLNQNTGYISAGGGQVYKSTNSGLNWIQVSSRPGWVFWTLWYEDEQDGYAAGSDGVIAKTTNGGTNWTQIFFTNNRLNSIEFINNETGFIVGDWGNIIKTTNGGLTFTENNISELTKSFELNQNYPNPFNPETNISFSINENNSYVSLQVYDVTGKMISEVTNGIYQAGNYETKFNGKNLPSGVYFYRLTVNSGNQNEKVFSQTKRMILMK
ncbi:MAG TPA: hypothetical protein DEP28_07985 [Bacteroidetes bacterium]|nr:hypothetical protein [Bacteroidota bacterium]HCN37430.1 hypothetical protein [Bacteroidota bacterium]